MSGEFTRVDVSEATRNLTVTLRKKGIHKDADVETQIFPKLTDEEIVDLQAKGHLEEDANVRQYDNASIVKIGEATEDFSDQQFKAALGIAEALAAQREVDSARVNIMGTYMFGDYSDFIRDTILFVRTQPIGSSTAPPPPPPAPEGIGHHETQGGLGLLTR